MSNIDIPTMEEPVTRDGGDDTERRRMSFIWWRFLQSLANRMTSSVPSSSATGIVAAGTTQGDATPLTEEWNVVATTPANSGVIIEPFGTGTSVTVYNDGANALDVYPPVGYFIDAGLVNAPYVLPATKSQVFSQVDDTLFRTAQLG